MNNRITLEPPKEPYFTPATITRITLTASTNATSTATATSTYHFYEFHKKKNYLKKKSKIKKYIPYDSSKTLKNILTVINFKITLLGINKTGHKKRKINYLAL